jgi:hypothetical protein
MRDEIIIPLTNGWSLRSEAGDNVRLCKPGGSEHLYWDQNEWHEDPVDVMAAIFGAATTLPATDIAVHDNDADVSYHFWTNGTAVGYEVHFPDGRIEFFYLNPSDGSDDGVPTVFVYQGTEADPGADTPLHHYIVDDAVPADKPDSVKLVRDRLARELTEAVNQRAAGAHPSTYLLGQLNEPGISWDDAFNLRAWDYDPTNPQEHIVVTEADLATATCKHCGRTITRENGAWVDPEATGDDAMWRETCDLDDTFTAEHEPDITLDQVIDEATEMGLLDDEPTPKRPGLSPDLLRKLLADWYEAEMYVLSETGSSADWQSLINDAKSRHEAFGLPWNNSFVPDYVREILAIDNEGSE